MKVIFKIVVVFMLIAFVLYFAGAFLAWNINPKAWGEEGRYMALLLLFMLTALYAANEY